MYYIGIDIGGTKCAAVLGSDKISDGIIDKIAFDTASKGSPSEVIDELMNCVDILLLRNNIEIYDLRGIGISCGGPLDSRAGLIKSPPNLPGWIDIPIVSMFREKYGVDTMLQNDANACAVAEWRFGAAKGYKNIIFLTFGTGMGAGLILDGHLYSGTNDMAGEVGHIRLADEGPEGFGKEGSFEGFCSGGGIAKMAKTMALAALENNESSPLFDNIEKITAKSLAIAAKDGDAFAKSVYGRCGKKLGLALSILIDILNPELIVIGSIYERNTEMFNELIAPIIASEAISYSREVCKIVPASLGDSIGDYAALSLAMGGY